jgi:hypothetical protein
LQLEEGMKKWKQDKRKKDNNLDNVDEDADLTLAPPTMKEMPKSKLGSNFMKSFMEKKKPKEEDTMCESKHYQLNTNRRRMILGLSLAMTLAFCFFRRLDGLVFAHSPWGSSYSTTRSLNDNNWQTSVHIWWNRWQASV